MQKVYMKKAEIDLTLAKTLLTMHYLDDVVASAAKRLKGLLSSGGLASSRNRPRNQNSFKLVFFNFQ